MTNPRTSWSGQFLRVDQNSLQAFYKRFSGHERTWMSDRQGADARRDATSGHFVCFRCPGAGALDEVNQVRIPGGAKRAAAERPCWHAKDLREHGLRVRRARLTVLRGSYCEALCCRI